MIHKAVILLASLMLGLGARVTASEMTASLASKVADSDLVAIVEITAVERGKIHVPEDWYSAAQDFTMRAEVLDRIKGRSSDTVTISAYSTSYTIEDEDGLGFRSIGSTAGFSAYSIEPGQSYIAYLREDGSGHYRLTSNSNQFLEVISSDGSMVNDVGQTRDQVRLAPKLRTLRALARGGSLLAIATRPIFLVAAFGGAAWLFIALKRSKRRRRAATPKEDSAEQDVTPNA